MSFPGLQDRVKNSGLSLTFQDGWHLCSRMGHDQWSCSSGWLSRWKVRHNIRYRRVCGENAAVDKDVCEEWTETVLLPVLRRYDPCDVFNADETGLYWRLLPDKTHAVSGETCTGGKMS